MDQWFTGLEMAAADDVPICDEKPVSGRLEEKGFYLKTAPPHLDRVSAIEMGIASRCRQIRIAHATQLLIENGHRIVTCPIEQDRHFGWEVFVQLEPHLRHSLLG